MRQNKDYYELIKQALHVLPKHTCVKFALFCARDVAHYADDKCTVRKTLDLVELWLMGRVEVLEKNLYAPSTFASGPAAYYAHASAAYSAHAAAYDEYATNATHAASAAATATYATALGKNRKYRLYYKHLVSIVTPLQKIILLEIYE